MEKQLVVFELAQELYGVDIKRVELIIKMQTIAYLPQAPEFVRGITNLRGTILPVIDLRRKLGLPAVDDSSDSRIIVVLVGDSKVGIIVDSVSEVLTVADDAVEAAPAMAINVDANYVSGIAKVENRLVILLEMFNVLGAFERQELMV